MDQEDSWRINGQISGLENAIVEANVALNMFDQAQATSRAPRDIKSEFEARAEISHQVQEELFPDGVFPELTPGTFPNADFFLEYEKRNSLIHAEVQLRMLRSGFLPWAFDNKPQFILAKSFIHALDLFGKFLGDIAEDVCAPDGVTDTRTKYFKALPDLQEVRNSIQHAEDRSKGMHRSKKIDIKKVDESKFPIDGAALVKSALINKKFVLTMADGHYGAVDITADSLLVMRDSLLEVYSAFEWTGGAQVFPR
jgi:hypothetical protein